MSLLCCTTICHPMVSIRITTRLSIGSAGQRSSSNEVHEDRTAEFLFNSIDCLCPFNPSSYVTSPHWPRDANCKPIIIIDSFTCSPQFSPTCTRSHISQMYTPNWFNLDVNWSLCKCHLYWWLTGGQVNRVVCNGDSTEYLISELNIVQLGDKRQVELDRQEKVVPE